MVEIHHCFSTILKTHELLVTHLTAMLFLENLNPKLSRKHNTYKYNNIIDHE